MLLKIYDLCIFGNDSGIHLNLKNATYKELSNLAKFVLWTHMNANKQNNSTNQCTVY